MCIAVMMGVLCLVGCGKQQPQNPTYHSGHTPTREDSALIQLMEINTRMVEEADRQICQYAEGYTRRDIGAWTKGLPWNDRTLSEESRVRLNLRVYQLDSTLLEDITETVTVGQISRMEALADVVPEMNIGDTIEMLVPWYVGYGSTGNEHVAPYTNLRLKLSIYE